MPESLEPRIAPATFVVTNLNDAGEGSLRDAALKANNQAGEDTIVFKQGLEGTIGINSQILISDTLNIKGPGAKKLILDGNLNSRIFLVADLDPEKDSRLTVSGLTFFRGFQNASDGAGGAISSFESLSVNGCIFLGNSADGTLPNFIGGAIFVNNAPGVSNVPLDLEIQNSAFFGNQNFARSGGAVTAQVGGEVKLINNVFSGNHAHDDGGAVFLQAGAGEVLLIKGCRFFGNGAAHGGAALLTGTGFGNDGESKVIVRGSRLAGNSSTNVEAGALAINGGDVLIEKTSFTQNTATGEGGALDAGAYSSLIIRSTQFLDNAALAAGAIRGGGAMHLDMPDNAVTRVIASIIAGNRASGGGGILVDEGLGRLDVIGSRFENNDAAESGGGILVLAESGNNDSANVSIIRSKFTGNDAEADDAGGGGISFAGDGRFTMQESQMIGNTAFRLGGGLLLVNTEVAEITNCLLMNNSAFGAGGGIWADGPIEANGSKIAGNFADVGGGLLGSDRIVLNLCTVSGNFAGGAGGIAHSSIDPILNRTKVVHNVSVDGLPISEF
jgi:predicted outer membrane repeat protein